MSKLKNPRAVTLPYGDFYTKVSVVDQLTYLCELCQSVVTCAFSIC